MVEPATALVDTGTGCKCDDVIVQRTKCLQTVQIRSLQSLLNMHLSVHVSDCVLGIAINLFGVESEWSHAKIFSSWQKPECALARLGKNPLASLNLRVVAKPDLTAHADLELHTFPPAPRAGSSQPRPIQNATLMYNYITVLSRFAVKSNGWENV